MSVELAKDLWDELKGFVNSVDRDEAAEIVVSVLIDHDIDADQIRRAFKHDSAIKDALGHYLTDDAGDDYIDDYDDEDDEY